eukprot:scaffold169289_cov53-Attheya_sp.AAC.1
MLGLGLGLGNVAEHESGPPSECPALLVLVSKCTLGVAGGRGNEPKCEPPSETGLENPPLETGDLGDNVPGVST